MQKVLQFVIFYYTIYNIGKVAFTLSNIEFFQIQQFLKNQKQRREKMKRRNAKTLGAVYIYTHTHTLCLLEDKISIFLYALLNIYIRDG